jgi:hypothetical protein
MLQRRDDLHILAITAVALAGAAASATIALAAAHLWECNWCHQQYQGDSPPRFAKCPAKDMKQTHWWIKKN